MKRFSLLVLCFLQIFVLSAQKEITHEDIWYLGTFRMASVYGVNSMNNGESYTSLNMARNSIVQYNYETGKQEKVLFKIKDFEDVEIDWIYDYTFNNNETRILISSNYEPIYRHSFKAEYYIFDIENNTLKSLSDKGKQQLASFSPQGDNIAFVRDNNIYYRSIDETTEYQITTDGEWNHIINGAPDWVYEEEFSYNKAYEWSPDGNAIAFLKTDETNVKQFDMVMYGDLYPEHYEYKYPKAGEDNSKVSLHIYHLNTKKIVEADLGNLDDMYIPRIYWTQSPGVLAAVKMNRLQNEYELFTIDAKTGKSQVLFSLNDDKYIEITDDLTFIPNGEKFMLTHESDGYRHIYVYDNNGEQINQVTSGSWDVTEVYGYCPETETVYYQAAESSPLNREVYSIKIDGSNKKKLSETEGYNEAEFSKGFKYFINFFSDANTPYYITLNNGLGKTIRDIETNDGLKDKIKNEYKFSPKEFFTFTTEEGVELNGWMIKPNDFKKNKKYPVLMYVYGGPGAQTVNNSWDHNLAWWQMLAQKGYIIVSVDNRGTGARGKNFRQITYGELGKYETIDQIEAAKYLAGLKYVDGSRIGMFGWSYGGYLTALCLTKGAEYFKAGIAVAPVTNWRHYDTIYTERYNGLPQDNPSGYDDNSPVNHVDMLKGSLLLVHGTADDNVHFQNSVDLVTELISKNKQFDTMYYPNSNHGIYSGNARIHLYTKMTDFLLEKL
jgi:dipeptidyl-peptidase 4